MDTGKQKEKTGLEPIAQIDWFVNDGKALMGVKGANFDSPSIGNHVADTGPYHIKMFRQIEAVPAYRRLETVWLELSSWHRKVLVERYRKDVGSRGLVETSFGKEIVGVALLVAESMGKKEEVLGICSNGNKKDSPLVRSIDGLAKKELISAHTDWHLAYKMVRGTRWVG